MVYDRNYCFVEGGGGRYLRYGYQGHLARWETIEIKAFVVYHVFVCAIQLAFGDLDYWRNELLQKTVDLQQRWPVVVNEVD